MEMDNKEEKYYFKIEEDVEGMDEIKKEHWGGYIVEIKLYNSTCCPTQYLIKKRFYRPNFVNEEKYYYVRYRWGTLTVYYIGNDEEVVKNEREWKWEPVFEGYRVDENGNSEEYGYDGMIPLKEVINVLYESGFYREWEEEVKESGRGKESLKHLEETLKKTKEENKEKES